ncbi:hypothetical protein EYC84_009845 [Monilinia fructicola]|uniref:alpha-1,2-Mannosidase n=1 Tax=Monilinia fructicola TaxID=38448 RepID=A0A5M9JED4_MONFR|nr:hypothetical protein EYC84_009845 [Monilinia fructicola]
MIPLPTESPINLPRIQFDFEYESPNEQQERETRQEAVKDNFLRIWQSYKQKVGIDDEHRAPGIDLSHEDWGDTLIECLDTLLIMDFQSEFEYAAGYLYRVEFSKSKTSEIDILSSSTRNLGGLLAAHDLTDGRYPLFLVKALELGNILYAAFDTPDRMPILNWRWKLSKSAKYQTTYEVLDPAMASLSLEFTRLSQVSADPKYFDAAQRVIDRLDEEQSKSNLPGLWSANKDRRFFALGTSTNSFIYYLQKQYILLRGVAQQYRNMYDQAVETAEKHLFFNAMNQDNFDLVFSGNIRVEENDNVFKPNVQSSTCAVGGMLAIGAQIFNRSNDLVMASKLINGCIWAHSSTKSGIIPESFALVDCNGTKPCSWVEKKWQASIALQNSANPLDMEESNWKQKAKNLRLPPGFASISDKSYLLRPHTIESIFTLYRITGNSSLPDVAWKIFQSLYEHTFTPSGNAGLSDVTLLPPPQTEKVGTIEMIQILKKPTLNSNSKLANKAIVYTNNSIILYTLHYYLTYNY